VTHPNACAESLELTLLREIRDEMREEREETRQAIRALRADLNGVIAAQQQIGLAMGLEIVITAPKPTPPPIQDPRASWAHPDMGGR